MEETLLYRAPTWLIALLLLGLMVVLALSFYRVGERLSRVLADKDVADLGPVDAAVAGLLGLLLALSFTLASERFVTRQDLVVKEANAIGTAYLRCSLLESEDRAWCEERLRAYVDLRLAFFAEERNLERYREIVRASEQVQQELWARTADLVRRQPSYPALGLLLQALNAVIDVHAERIASFRLHVPHLITVLLLLLSLAWAGFLGLALGLKRRRRTGAIIAFAVLVSLVTAATLDLDRPRRGIISLKSAEKSLIDLRDALHRP